MASAALNFALLVSRFLLLKIGPLPEVLALGMSTPFSCMHAENFASACLNAGSLKRFLLAPMIAGLPHFLMAASY